MSFSQNQTRVQRQKDVEHLIAQWPNFDQKYLLRSELGLAFDSIVEAFGQSTPRVKHYQLKFGKDKAITLNPFRGLRAVSINVEKIMANENPYLVAFPLSLFNLNAANNDDVQGGYYNAVNFGRSDMSMVFAAFAEFYNCTWRGSLNQATFDKAQVIGCHFLDVDMVRFIANAPSFRDTHLVECKARGSHFFFIPAIIGPEDHLLFHRTDIVDCDFSNSIFADQPVSSIYSSLFTVSESNISDTSFDNSPRLRFAFVATNVARTSFRNATIAIVTKNVSSQFGGPGGADDTKRGGMEFCDFTHATGSISIGSFAKNCFFDYANLINGFGFDTSDGQNVKVLTGSSFQYTTFPNNVNFAGADIRGCDFTGSNLNTAMLQADKAAFRAAVGAFNDETIWVDGTKLGDA